MVSDRITKPLSIVLVDDHDKLRWLTKRILKQDADIDVVGEAADGVEALDVIALQKPDVVVTDLNMPRMDGIELTRKITVMFPSIPVVMLSLYTDEPYVYAALEAGAICYVFKGSNINVLTKAICAARSRETFLGPPISEQSLEAYRLITNRPPLPLRRKLDAG